jgi:phytoene synthase
MWAGMSLAETVRRHDPDRFFATLFAPAAAREALFTLYAFNHELARAREVTREPGLALIRLQWWHEVVEGAARQHEVAGPLRALIESGRLPAAPLRRMIEAREAEVEGAPETLAAFVGRMRQGPGALAQAAGALLGADALPRLGDLGAAYGVAGTLGNMAALARQERCAVPLDVLAQAGLSCEAAMADPGAAQARVRPALAQAGRALLGSRQRVPRAVLAAALPAALARRDLARATPPARRGAGDRLAVLWAALSGAV